MNLILAFFGDEGCWGLFFCRGDALRVLPAGHVNLFKSLVSDSLWSSWDQSTLSLCSITSLITTAVVNVAEPKSGMVATNVNQIAKVGHYQAIIKDIMGQSSGLSTKS